MKFEYYCDLTESDKYCYTQSVYGCHKCNHIIGTITCPSCDKVVRYPKIIGNKRPRYCKVCREKILQRSDKYSLNDVFVVMG